VIAREQRAVDAERRERHRGRQLVGVGLVAMLVAALAVFGTVQWRSAATAKGEVDHLLTVADLVTESNAALTDDPELALLLAVQSVRETVDLGFATEEAVDAVHMALHELGVQYPVDDATQVAVRSGPHGLVGVYVLPPKELVDLAESTVDRRLTDDECAVFMSRSCPADAAIPDDLPLRGGPDSYGATDLGPRALAGTRVTMTAGALRGDDGFVRQLEAFTELTGIEVDLAASDDQQVVNAASGNLVRPDLVGSSSGVPAWAADRALDIGRFVDAETLRTDFDDDVLGVASVGAAVRAVPVTLDLKGLVFYPKAAFVAAGYTVPRSWDDLVALSHRIVADGGTPWCFGFASGVASGWPGSDLIESLVLRVGGIDTYEAWRAGAIGFTDPAVMQAGQMADALIGGPGFVRGGPQSISTESYDEQLLHLLQRDDATGDVAPACWLYHQSSAMLRLVPPHAQIGDDLDFFVMPPVDADEPAPSLGGALFASALVDRPEVRALVSFIAGPAWGRVWATDPGGSFVSANRRFDPSAYGDPSSDPAAAVRVEVASATRAALDAGQWSYDASDLMPAAIGGWTDEGGPGAFWRGMIDWVDGTRTIEQVLSDIDSEWAALRLDPDG
jgi:alpha-glucoside transport system substrate-binding protein